MHTVEGRALGKLRFQRLHPPNIAGWTDLGEALWTGERRRQVSGAVGGAHGTLTKDTPTEGEFGLTYPVRQESIVSDPLEAPNAVHCISGFMQFLRLCGVYCL